MVTPQIRTAKLYIESCISGSALSSLQDIYLKRCKSRTNQIIKDSNHPGNCLFCLLPSGKRFRSMMAKTERLRRSFFPQAIGLITSTWLNLLISNIFIILHHPYCCYVYIPGTTCLHIPLAHPRLYYYLLSSQYTVLHILFHCTFYSLFVSYSYLYYIYSRYVSFFFFALSIERTCPDLHFTTDYTLYNWVCDN